MGGRGISALGAVGHSVGWRDRAREALLEARARTCGLLQDLTDAELRRQHSPLMSPPIWDVAHVANYEEQWLLRALGQPGVSGPDVDALYDAFRHPRAGRSELPLLPPDRAWRYLAQVRERVLEQVDAVSEDGSRLLDGGFVYGMVAQHEQQHGETLCATLQLMDWPLRPPAGSSPNPGLQRVGEVLVPGGPFWMGSDDAWAYDNERPRHLREVPPFFIEVHPVTNGAFAEFVRDGGYDDARLWCEAGWAHRQREPLVAPLFWSREGSGWVRRRFGVVEPLPPEEPVQHVCWYEADAFARWAGKRLPTEAEWEKAASFGREPRRYPWGNSPVSEARANLGQRSRGPTEVGGFPEGASALGVMGLLGDVWEWTASDFAPYPGFEAFPYREYSEVFFGSAYKVLRGGSWATAPIAIRNSFRNWDFPIRRQIFAGFRCARDA